MCGSRALRTTETKDENTVYRDGERTKLSESCQDFDLQPEFSQLAIRADSGVEEEKFEAPYRDEAESSA